MKDSAHLEREKKLFEASNIPFHELAMCEKRRVVRAFCDSDRCCESRAPGRSMAEKPNAKRNDTWCPDCGDALVWKGSWVWPKTVGDE